MGIDLLGGGGASQAQQEAASEQEQLQQQEQQQFAAKQQELARDRKRLEQKNIEGLRARQGGGFSGQTDTPSAPIEESISGTLG